MKTKFSGILTLFIAFAVQITFAQQKTISGTVTDGSSLPLPGATVLVKGTNTGTSTNFDGNYSISAKQGVTLVISFVGYTTKEVKVGTSTTINVTMTEDAQALQEVVITSVLGTKAQPRAQGYSSTSLSSEDLTEVTNANPFESLSGKVAGLDLTVPSQPGATPKVIIRGFSSITGSNQPLYIVDGTPITNSSNGTKSDVVSRTFDGGSGINDIDPNTIESMTVLKSSAATALYGSRAANGAILITTKKGKDSSKVSVEFLSAIDFSEVSRVPHLQNSYGEGWAGEGFSALPGSGLSGASNENGSWGPAYNGQIRPWGQIVNNSQQIKPYDALPDNLKDFYDTGYSYTNSARISGGSENSDFSLGITDVNSDGVIPTGADIYKRQTFNFNGGLKNDKFSVRINANFVKKNQNAVNTGQGDAAGQGNTFMQEIIQVARDISIVDLKDYTNNPFNTNSNFYTPYASNPYWVINENSTNIGGNRFYGNFNFAYNILPNLIATWQFGGDIENLKTKSYGAIVDYLEGSPQDLLATIPVVGGVTESQTERKQYDTYITLNYDTALTSDLKLDASVGFTYNQRSSDFLQVSVTDLDIPKYYEISNSASTPNISQNNSLRRNFGVYGTATLGFLDSYFLTVTSRNDWSSTLPINNNSFFYPSAALSAIVIDNNDTFVKLRASASRVGNDTEPYKTSSTLVQGAAGAYFGQINMPFGGVNSFELNSQLGNGLLKPEITTEYEVGTEVRLFNRRVTLDASYYVKDTKDLLLDRLLPRSTGYLQVTGNYADLTNKGVELFVGLKPIISNNFSWNIDYTFTKNKNEVTDLRGLDRLVINSAYGTTFNAEKGRPLGVFRFKGPAINDQGQYIVDENTGFYVQSEEEQDYGTSQRDFVMGLKNSFKYKNFNLSFSFDWKEGGKMYSYTNRLLAFTGGSIASTYNERNPFIIPNSVNDNGDDTYSENTTPIGFGDVTNFWGTASNPAIEYTNVIDKSFVRMRDLSISYSVPSSEIQKVGFSSASITLYGKNLFLWTPDENPYVDPEVSTFGSDLASEFGEFAANPAQRAYGVSLKLSL